MRSRPAQQVGHHLLVLQRQGSQGVGQGKDDMTILDGQEFGLAILQPLSVSQGLTLGAMTVATRVGGDGLVTAVVALLHMATPGGSATEFDGPPGAPLLWGQRGPVQVLVRGSILAEDSGDFQKWCGHGCASGVGEAAAARQRG